MKYNSIFGLQERVVTQVLVHWMRTFMLHAQTLFILFLRSCMVSVGGNAGAFYHAPVLEFFQIGEVGV